MKCRLEVDTEGKQKLEGEPRQGSGSQKHRKVQKETKEQEKDKFDGTDSLQGCFNG